MITCIWKGLLQESSPKLTSKTEQAEPTCMNSTFALLLFLCFSQNSLQIFQTLLYASGLKAEHIFFYVVCLSETLRKLFMQPASSLKSCTNLGRSLLMYVSHLDTPLLPSFKFRIAFMFNRYTEGLQFGLST
jgi:hypothetical protein